MCGFAPPEKMEINESEWKHVHFFLPSRNNNRRNDPFNDLSCLNAMEQSKSCRHPNRANGFYLNLIPIYPSCAITSIFEERKKNVSPPEQNHFVFNYNTVSGE